MIKNKVKDVVKRWLIILWEKLEKHRKFRSVDLQEEKNDDTKSTNTNFAKSDNPGLAAKAVSDLGFVAAKKVK